MQAIVTAIILTVAGLSHHISSAQMACNGVISGMVTSDVTCTGGCVLDGATITGSVLCSVGTLVAKGGSSISGNLQVGGSVSRVQLESVTVSGTVDIKDATSLNDVIIEAGAILTSVNINNAPSASLNVSGLLSSISMVDAGDLLADKLNATGRILVDGGNGAIQICGSTIGGGLMVLRRDGSISIDTNLPDCGTTTLSGAVSIQTGTSDVTIRGANLQNGDIVIADNSGNVILSQTSVSDIRLERNTGALTITNVTADSDTSVIEHTGDVLLSNLNTLGDALIQQIDGSVMLTDSDLGLEDISIILVSQDVTVDNNINLNLSVVEVQGTVTITDNIINVAVINKNTGGVDISNNVISTLNCSDNVPAPTGSGNNVLLSQTGQCATL